MKQTVNEMAERRRQRIAALVASGMSETEANMVADEHDRRIAEIIKAASGANHAE